MTKEILLLSDWGGVVNSGPIGEQAPLRLVDFYKLAKRYATRPVKVSVGAGPVNLAWHVYFKHYKDPRELSFALAPLFNQEMKALVAAGADFLQYEDLGAWLPLFTKDTDDYKWIGDVVRQCVDGVDAKIAWHFCYGNAWGNRLAGLFPAGYEAVLPYFYDLPIDQFVLDFANRDMVDIAALEVSAEGQGGGDRRDRRAHQHGRDARGGRGAHPQGDRGGAARAGLSDHRLRDEAALAHGGADEAESAGRRREDRPQGTRARLTDAERLSGPARNGRGPAGSAASLLRGTRVSAGRGYTFGRDEPYRSRLGVSDAQALASSGVRSITGRQSPAQGRGRCPRSGCNLCPARRVMTRVTGRPFW